MMYREDTSTPEKTASGLCPLSMTIILLMGQMRTRLARAAHNFVFPAIVPSEAEWAKAGIHLLSNLGKEFNC